MLRIGIAYSLKPEDRGDTADGPDDLYEEFDRPETIEALADAIRGDGHDVSFLGDGREFLAKMLEGPPDFVFNFAEGRGIGRDREARVPAVCEMLGVPYSGSDPLTMAVALDKVIAKSIVADEGGCLVPGSITIGAQAGDVERMLRLGAMRAEFPGCSFILKPSFEGSSKGIRGRCVTDSFEEAGEIAARLARDYSQPIVVEQFIPGDEITVGITGTGRKTLVLGVMRILPKRPTDRFVYSLEVKRDWRNQVRYEAPADLPAAVMGDLLGSATSAYAALGCRDVARLDYRIWEGRPYFIEANPLPGLAPVSSDLVILAEGYGISHGDLVRMILRTALDRVGLGGGDGP